MASSTKKPAAAIKNASLVFNPDWVSDPAPPWLREFIKTDLLRQHTELQLKATIDMMKVQQEYLARSLELVQKSK